MLNILSCGATWVFRHDFLTVGGIVNISASTGGAACEWRVSRYAASEGRGPHPLVLDANKNMGVIARLYCLPSRNLLDTKQDMWQILNGTSKAST